MPLRDLRKRPSEVRHPRPGSHLESALEFLRAHPKDGWRAVELSKRLDIDEHTLGAALRRLRQRGLVDKIDEHWFALPDNEVAKIVAMRLTTRLANEKLGPEDPADWPEVSQE